MGLDRLVRPDDVPLLRFKKLKRVPKWKMEKTSVMRCNGCHHELERLPLEFDPTRYGLRSSLVPGRFAPHRELRSTFVPARPAHVEIVEI